jgi:hypothetical protein
MKFLSYLHQVKIKKATSFLARFSLFLFLASLASKDGATGLWFFAFVITMYAINYMVNH